MIGGSNPSLLTNSLNMAKLINVEKHQALLRKMGNLYEDYPIIHVGGTDGKGSTSNMIASILIEAGYKVGTFNTPPMGHSRNCIKINGVSMSMERSDKIARVVMSFGYNRHLRVPRAFTYFAEEKVDVAVIETTIGSHSCPTNIVQPIVSVLTNITKEHLDLFDNDFIKYANDKIDIIKPNTPIFIGETPSDSSIRDMIIEKADECKAPLVFTDDPDCNFILEHIGDGKYITKFGEISMCLGGDYQRNNLNIALNVIEELRKQGYNITNENIVDGLNHIYENTAFCGRWQLMQEKPLVILDGCHTSSAWSKVIPQLLKKEFNKLYIVSKFKNDKDVDSVFKYFPDEENIEYWFPTSRSKEFMSPKLLMEKSSWMTKAKRFEPNKLISNTLTDILSIANENDIIFIGGTLLQVHDVNRYFNKL